MFLLDRNLKSMSWYFAFEVPLNISICRKYYLKLSYYLGFLLVFSFLFLFFSFFTKVISAVSCLELSWN